MLLNELLDKTSIRRLFASLVFGFCLLGGVSLVVGQQDEPDPSEVESDSIFEEGATDKTDSSNDQTSGEASEPASESSTGQTGLEKSATHSPQAQDSGTAFAGLTREAGLGFGEVVSARPGRVRTYRVGMATEFMRASGVVRAFDQNSLMGGRVLGQATITEQFSLSTGIEARTNTNSFGRPKVMITQGDWHLGLRGHMEVQPGIYFGGDLTGYFPSSYQASGFDFGGVGVRPRVLLTLVQSAMEGSTDTQKAGKREGIIGHFNLAYRLDNTSNILPDSRNLSRVERFAQQISAYDFIEVGASTGYRIENIAPFVSWRLDIPVAGNSGICEEDQSLECVNSVGAGAFPHRLTGGVRWEPLSRLGLSLTTDVRLTPEDAAGVPAVPPYKILGSVSWTIDPSAARATAAPTPREFAVSGSVVDAETGDPIKGATLTYRKPKKTPQQTTQFDGTFETYKFSPGTVVEIEVSHSNYESRTVQHRITNPSKSGEKSEPKQSKDEAKKGDSKPVDSNSKGLEVQLTPKPATARLAGSVTTGSGEPVSGAEVEMEGPENYSATTDQTGSFDTEVKPGTYRVEIKGQNYSSLSREVDVAEDQSVQLAVSLQKSKTYQLVELSGNKLKTKKDLQFESGEAKLLASSHAVLDEVAQFIMDHPDLGRIRVEGHTDDEGPAQENLELSRKRANRVRNYLIDQGVRSGRLEAKGYGSKQPVVPNTSPRTRRLNRRVEFTVVQKSK